LSSAVFRQSHFGQLIAQDVESEDSFPETLDFLDKYCLLNDEQLRVAKVWFCFLIQKHSMFRRNFTSNSTIRSKKRSASMMFERDIALGLLMRLQLLKAIGEVTAGAFSLTETEYVLNLLELLHQACS
jgi:hypothetical protein